MKYRTQAEIEHICLAFGTTRNLGLTETSVQREWAKSLKNNQNITLEEVVTFYNNYNCRNGSVLVTFMVTDNITSIRTSSIDFLGVVNGPLSIENAESLQWLQIGSDRQGITPLSWFTCLMKGFEKLSQEQTEAFDDVCKQLVAFSVALARHQEESLD